MTSVEFVGMLAATEISLSELTTLIIGLIALFIGVRLRDHLPWLKRAALPAAVVGALLVAVLVLLADLFLSVKIKFAGELRSILLLVFFGTLGLSAKFRALAAGGRPLVILCAVTVLLIVAQNLAGMSVAILWGAHPFYGLLAGGLSFVGGPGTALAWASEAESAGLLAAQPVGVAASTLAVVTGALVAGPATEFVIRRRRLRSQTDALGQIAFADSAESGRAAAKAEPDSLARLISPVLAVAIAVYLGEQLNMWARDYAVMLPGFLSALVAGILITNGCDALRVPLASKTIEQVGEIALNVFLVISLMSTPLISVAEILFPLVLNVIVQILVIVVLAYIVLFPMLGRDYDAAVTVGGFLGFGLASMPVAMATMDAVAERHGPSPKAFLLIALAGSFFVDLANAGIAKLFLLLPIFATT